MRRLCLLLLPLPLLAQSADLVLRNTTIYTVDVAHPMAQAVAIKDGKIVFVGSDAAVSRFVGPATKSVDLKGRYVYPGLVDAHAHFTGIGQREMTLNLEGTSTKSAFLDKVEAAVKRAKPGEWVTGRGWIETFWTPPVFPTRHDLDRIAPNNPVVLTRADGHASIANSAALKIAGIISTSAAPAGGAINLDGDGQPTGMLIDAAQGMVRRFVPATTESDLERALELASEREISLGWTQVQDAHGTWAEAERMRKLYREGRIKVRIYKAISGPSPDAERLIAQGPGKPEFGDRFTVRDIKVVMDGALGSRGAAMLQPYSDDPHTTGLITTDTVAVKGMLTRALRAGIQVETHAIGDRGNHITLDLYEGALKAIPAAQRVVKEPRWRIEHSQIVTPADLPRFKQLGLIASMQPSHAIGDLFFVPSRIGMERIKGAYAWETFFKLGVPVAGGSDAPVERGEPMIEFYAAVARKSLDGKSGPGWHPEEKVTRAQALKMFTWFAAYAAFEEDRHGSIAVGKAADFTVLDADIMTIPEAKILSTKNVMTIIAGEVVYGGK
ncbi:MAG: amidohydrolase [Gemmatimonadales bacterium]